MATSIRKQRERAEREELILDVSRRMLVERGYLGLTMDRIAEATEYSKGTIYQHFSCKEEIVAALAIQTAEKRTGFFERAATFRGNSRERMAAIGEAEELFVRLHPTHFQSQKLIDAESLREKTSPERQTQRMELDFRCTQILSGVVRDAVAQGDLELHGPDTPESLTYGLWSMAFGSHLIQTLGAPLEEKGYGDPADMLRRNYALLLDGYGWRPLTPDHDYEPVYRRIRQEIFPDESRQVLGQ